MKHILLFAFPNVYAFFITCLLVTASESTLFDNIIRFFCPDTNLDNSLQASNSSKDLTTDIFENAIEISNQQYEKLRELELRLASQGRVIDLNSRESDLSVLRNPYTDPKIRDSEMAQLPYELISNMLNNRTNTSNAYGSDFTMPERLDALLDQVKQECEKKRATARCDDKLKYRRLDGQCNNLQNPRWGSAMNCQPRLLPANYEGTSGFRRSVNGEPLPRPRTLSLNLHYDVNRPTNNWNHMYVFFGQLLDHDIILTPQSTTVGNQAIQCCPPAKETHPQCKPIVLRINDPFYSQFNQTCMNFVRSAICPTCTLGSRQVMNQVTSYIDASFVYGNSEMQSNSLRTNDGTGQLKTFRSSYGDLLPQSSDPKNDQCSFPEKNKICFQGGDSRVNQHTALTCLQTIFLREHNRIAKSLKQINPQWDDERTYQESRRIVGAEMQVITYNEYLPITLGDDRMSYFNLWTGSRTSYKRSVDATTWIEFTTAAFRFGHSLINYIVSNRPLDASNQPLLFKNSFFNPFPLYRGIAGPLIEGTTKTPAQWFDRYLVTDVTEYLYRPPGQPKGLDLASININRGRDHGLPPYVEMVRYCSNGTDIVKSFDDLVSYNLMRPEQAVVLRNNYKFVQDIDLWPGIVCEIPNKGAVVGPTAICIIGLQFYNLKFGDRYYFENKNESGSFSPGQLQQLRKTTLSQIICSNTEISEMPRNAMLFSSMYNPNIKCSSMPKINLSYWKE